MNFSFNGCYARLDDDCLIIGNAHIERVWRINDSGFLFAVSLLQKASGQEWLRGDGETPAPTPAASVPTETRTVTLSQISTTERAVEKPSLCVELSARGQAASFSYRFQIFPDASGVGIALHIKTPQAGEQTSADANVAPSAAPTGVESDAPVATAPAAAAETLADAQEVFRLAPLHLSLTQVILQDQTDHREELVFENSWLLLPPEGAFGLMGNVFYVEDTLTKNGLLFLKVAPLPNARPEKCAVDLQVQPVARTVAVLGNGLAPGAPGTGYEIVTLTYAGGKWGRIAALQAYQRQVRPYVGGRDGLLVSNTWGDRNRDAALNADFLSREIEAAARLGVDVVQIDDGWQVGTTSNSVNAQTLGGVWEGFHNARADFWSVHPDRLPDGLAPLTAQAKTRQMRFGLWFAPDSHDDFANWETDADTILRLHRDEAVDYIKIDGVKLRTKQGEKNLQAFFDKVLVESKGRVVFDGDVTAEDRFGYFGMTRIGPLFVENRYTDWHRYWPHATLRNLWRLAHYVDPLRLRMEFLNPARHEDKYPGDPLAPAAYGADYLFATVMFASPLGWFEVQHLPSSYFDHAAPLIATWKNHRDALFGGTLYPIGDVPDGTSWTGFVSVAHDAQSAIALVFREYNDRAQHTFALPVSGLQTVEVLAGDGQATVEANGVLMVDIPEKQRFVFLRLTGLVK